MSINSMIVLQCTCGETYFVAEQHIGSQIKYACGRSLLITRSSSAAKFSDEINAKSDFRAGKRAARKSFSVRYGASVAVGFACLIVGLIVFAGYSLIHNAANTESAPVVSHGFSSPAAPTKSQPTPTYNSNHNGTGNIPPNNVEPERAPVSLSNGATIAPAQGPRGNRYLTVINETDSDAAIKLVENTTEKTRRFFYVRAHSRATVRGIGNEECRLRFSTGADWDAESRKFLRDAAYSEFENALNFRRTNYSVRLKPSITGNALVDSIDEEKFADK